MRDAQGGPVPTTRVWIDGRAHWLLDGRLLPVLAGGSGEGEPGGDVPPAGAGSGNADGDTGGDTGDAKSGGAETFDAEYVRKLRAEAAGYRKRASEAEGKLKEREDAELGEGERLRKQAEEAGKRAVELEAALRQERGQRALAEAASRVGIAPELAARLVDVEFEDDGSVRDVEPALKALLAKHPQLAHGSGAGSSSSATNPARSNGRGALTMEDIKRMSPSEINARWADVQAVLGAQAS